MYIIQFTVVMQGISASDLEQIILQMWDVAGMSWNVFLSEWECLGKQLALFDGRSVRTCLIRVSSQLRQKRTEQEDQRYRKALRCVHMYGLTWESPPCIPLFFNVWRCKMSIPSFDLCHAMLTSLPENLKLSHRFLRRMPAYASMIGGIEEFRKIDGPALETMFPRKDKTTRYVWLARRQPFFDRNGEFDTHLWRVSNSVMRAHPDLWKFPVALAVVSQCFPDQEVTRLLDFCCAALQARTEQNCTRRVDAMAKDITDEVMFAYRAWRRGAVSSLIPAEPWCKKSLAEHIARCIGGVMRSSIRTAFSVNSDRKVPHRYTAAVRFWNGIIRNGVVAPGISVTDTMSIRQIAQLVRNLQKENPDLYAALRTGETLYRTRRMILREEIQLLLSVPKSKQEECVFLLLYTLGLRSGAIAGMKLMDIWDPGMARVSDTANIREKFTEFRSVRFLPEVRAALQDYVTTSYDKRCSYLFGHSRSPNAVPRFICRHILNRLCKRAGINERINPHAFRSYMVSMFVQNGKTIDQASKYLGHKQVITTFKNYYHPDTEMMAHGIPFLNECEPHEEDLTSEGCTSDSTTRLLELSTEKAQILHGKLQILSEQLNKAKHFLTDEQLRILNF